MADENDRIDQELADGIAMLEQILEVMPNDLEALRALYNAYCKAQRRDKAFTYLCRLADAACDTGDDEAIAFADAELRTYSDEYPAEVISRLARLQARVTERQEKAPGRGAAGEKKRAAKSETDINEELALAWKLFEEQQFTEEEYSAVLHDLTEVSTKEVEVPVTVLHVLQDRGYGHMNRLLNYLSAQSGVPVIALRNFDIPPEATGLLPPEIPIHEGALPFEFFGEDVLLAVLNPFNRKLVEKVEKLSGRRCHTFLVRPDDYDAALDRFRALGPAASPA